MSGVTKHIFEHEIRDVISMWSKQLKEIKNILPQSYTEEDIIAMLKEFYPHEWNSVEIKYWYYEKKDRNIKKRFGKKRYNMKRPEQLLRNVAEYKNNVSSVSKRLCG
ncbi:MAG: hypothetical protein ACLTST_03705 [Lachnospiraceae bacterium]